MATAVKASPAPPPTGIRYCVRCLAIYRQDFQRCPLDGESLVVGASDPWVGSTVGKHYVIEALVGEGAMGRVYRAHHQDIPDRHYAIKIMIGDYAATAQMRARFQLEAEHASKLAHPNVVGVIDYGMTDKNVNFLVMDLVEGPSLGAIVQRGPMEPERVIKLARQLCEGLDHAHGRGMIHRDFKPDNILVVGDGDLEVARIADFGLALSTNHEVRLTTTGIVCTPAYAAPEQLRGQPIDHRVDLYALGTTMFEMLSGGILPFNGDLDASVRSKLMGDAPSILMVAPNVPPALVSIVGRLLSADPRRRPRSARAVMRALDGALAAPRAQMRTDQTQPLRLPPAANKQISADDTSSMPEQVASKSPSEVPVEDLLPRSTFGRKVARVFATGIVLGGLFAWFQSRGPTVGQAVANAETVVGQAEQAFAGTAPQVTAFVLDGPAHPEATVAQPIDEPVSRVADQPAATPHVIAPVSERDPAPPKAKPKANAKAKPKARPAPKPRTPPKARPVPTATITNEITPENADLLAANFSSDDDGELTPQKLALRYGAIGRELRQLDTALGRENTDDLWAAYRLIQINQAVATPQRREEIAYLLQTIQEAIVDRQP